MAYFGSSCFRVFHEVALTMLIWIIHLKAHLGLQDPHTVGGSLSSWQIGAGIAQIGAGIALDLTSCRGGCSSQSKRSKKTKHKPQCLIF